VNGHVLDDDGLARATELAALLVPRCERVLVHGWPGEKALERLGTAQVAFASPFVRVARDAPATIDAPDIVVLDGRAGARTRFTTREALATLPGSTLVLLLALPELDERGLSTWTATVRAVFPHVLLGQRGSAVWLHAARAPLKLPRAADDLRDPSCLAPAEVSTEANRALDVALERAPDPELPGRIHACKLARPRVLE
jgi:hypothetical protein